MNDKFWFKKVRELRRGKKIHHAKREVARALVGAGMTYREVADILEISVGSVHNVLKEPPAEVAPIVREMKARLAHKAFMLADHALSRITDMDMEKASLKEKAIAAAILMDKGRLLMERTGSSAQAGPVETEKPVYELAPANQPDSEIVQCLSGNENGGLEKVPEREGELAPEEEKV